MTPQFGVKIMLPDKKIVLTESGTVTELLLRLNLNPYDVLVTRNGELLLADDECIDGDFIAAISIVHGG